MTSKYVVKLSVNLDLLLDWWDAFALHLVMSLEFSATMNQLFYWLGKAAVAVFWPYLGNRGLEGCAQRMLLRTEAETWAEEFSSQSYDFTSPHSIFATMPQTHQFSVLGKLIWFFVLELERVHQKALPFCPFIIYFFFFWQHFLMSLKLLPY